MAPARRPSQRGRPPTPCAAGPAHPLLPGRLYCLDQHEAHCLVASPHEDLRLVCVFVPPLSGNEAHRVDPDAASSY
ncbi:ectoine synthase [Streptomyces sp. NBC_00354]|uniref:ectoine synthase n=1 Tax=Streptomyces sp. NBC_00354 TaxID=2975723 RepID=UPI002E2577DA